MTFAKTILSITAAVWIGYGLWLFVDPRGLGYMGYGLDNWSAIVEVQAMYGAAEVMLGIFALLGVLNPKRYMHSALLLWCMIYSSLVVGRIVGIIMWHGSFALQIGVLPDSYNPGSIYFLEFPSATLCLIALLKTRNIPELHA